ncbi:phosphate regulon sensor histidine kinase PhoR [Rhizobium sp. CG5]|uniref:phosphate regulon sensor histidine kinase PhoR n=1 Tax=Rhizobium sp. CG5 TaxID=2726076 RepID=UPI00203345AD|nr:phosphate regulon sensor histidine kinase PhoR [Rhizobium sp. CG5]MCM2472690.1 phosphate regulon sensor histidine kinase PhoR [Rhizobium sp. CG5]
MLPPLRRLRARLSSRWTLLLAAALAALTVYLSGADVAITSMLFGLCSIAILVHSPVKPMPASRPDVAEEEKVQADLLPPVLYAAYGALELPVVVFRVDATVLFQNRAMERAFGPLPQGSHVSARWRSPSILDVIRETVATDEPNQIEHSERLPSERVYTVRIAPIDLPAGVPNGEKLYTMSFKDISELRRIDRMRSDFVANASHELRTPLASLKGFIETMQGPARSDVKAQERFLAIMLDQANRMSRLVDDLLSLSRLELKAHLAPSDMVDLVPVIGHVSDSLAPLAADLGVDLRLHLPKSKVEVMGDRDELIQVFENLMENACKYGQEGKVVDVHVRNEPGHAVEVSIVDHGPGIPAEHVPRLTERFYRVSVADSRSKKGTGLGLAIVKHILTRHRARLIVKSEIGKGTDFTVRF